MTARIESPRSPLTRWTQRALWVLIPAVMFGAAEWGIRRVIEQRGVWYQRTERLVERQPVDYLFLGSSRVTAAVDKRAFTMAIEKQTGHRPTVDLLARGNTNLIHNYLALRNLAERHPQRLRGCVVLLELPGGLPPMFSSWKDTPRGWEGPWIENDSPHLLASVLQARDLPRLYGSDTSLENKCRLTFRYAVEPIRFISQRERVREVFMNRLNKLDDLVRDRLVPAEPASRSSPVDLAEAGGIRTDAQGVAMVREMMQQQTDSALRHQTPLRHWDDSLLPQLISLCRARQMHLVFFHMPQSPGFQRAAQTHLRKTDQYIFRQWAASYGVPIVSFDFPTEADDYPDRLHMSQTCGRAFSTALAQACVNTLGEGDTRIVKVDSEE